MTTHRITFNDTDRTASTTSSIVDSRYTEAADDTAMAIRYLLGVVKLYDDLLDDTSGADHNHIKARRYWINTALECARRA